MSSARPKPEITPLTARALIDPESFERREVGGIIEKRRYLGEFLSQCLREMRSPSVLSSRYPLSVSMFLSVAEIRVRAAPSESRSWRAIHLYCPISGR